MPTTAASTNAGRVIEITGPVLVCQFPEASLPPINQALRVVSTGFDVPTPLDITVEVQQHLGEGRVKCIAMQATDGLVRGMQA
ncbi:MAG: F0F1 ATP synthase subunit beta, partial [Terriglobales bacterium]